MYQHNSEPGVPNHLIIQILYRNFATVPLRICIRQQELEYTRLLNYHWSPKVKGTQLKSVRLATT